MKLTMKGKGASLIQGAAVVAVASLVGSEVAMAGADTTFNTALTSFTGFLEGSGGKIITVLSLAGGIVGLASGRFSLGQVAIPVGVGVGAGTGVPIVTTSRLAPFSNEWAASRGSMRRTVAARSAWPFCSA